MSRRLLLSVVAASMIAPGALYALPHADENKRDKASVDTTSNRKGRSGQDSDSDDNARKKLKPRKRPAPSAPVVPNIRTQPDEMDQQVWDTEFFVRSLFPQKNSGSLATLVAFSQ